MFEVEVTKEIFEELTLKLMSFNAEPYTACRLPCDSMRCLETFMPEVDQLQWSPTAHAFAQHQFSHVANFWKQGREATFRLEALTGGRAELNLTFQLPQASEAVPPPSPVIPAPAPQKPRVQENDPTLSLILQMPNPHQTFTPWLRG